MREPETDLIGKGIIYAVNQRHAAALTQALNEAASARWPGVYNSDFAVQVTSHVYDANIFGEQFKHNSLSGPHPEMPGYATSKTRVCVTVAMMTTGYDCPDLLNIGVCRPIKSPVDFTQIKGRGTRRHDFRSTTTPTRWSGHNWHPVPKKSSRSLTSSACANTTTKPITMNRVSPRPLRNRPESVTQPSPLPRILTGRLPAKAFSSATAPTRLKPRSS